MNLQTLTPPRHWPWLLTGLLALLCGLAALLGAGWAFWGVAGGFAVLFVLGLDDLRQSSHSVRRNFPLTGRLRYLLEAFRPEIRQYFVESDDDKLPFSRNQRAMVYARAKLENDKRGMGSLRDPYEPGTEWLAHAMRPVEADPMAFRVTVGDTVCSQPYEMPVFNISGMSFGSLSGAAIRALNRGAALGGFAQNTGEGSFSVHHQQGGDIILQVASGYFGFRTPDGQFDPELFMQRASHPQVKMIEVKLSQGAKPGHGGVLPAAKISDEIAAARGIPKMRDCVSPSAHSAFQSAEGLMEFISQLRELSDGKPVGIKLCIGSLQDWFELARAMKSTGQMPDFITVDGSEGGTGAAPVEFADHVGMPMRDGLRLVHNTLVGLGLRDRIRIGAAGKVISAFDIVRCMALGADWCNAGRGFMFSIGCIQSRSCHTDHCPTGVATQDPLLQRGLVVEDKAMRVHNYHFNTLRNLADLIGAAGLRHPSEVRPEHLMVRRADGRAVSLAEELVTIAPGALLSDEHCALLPEPFRSGAFTSRGSG